MKTTCKENKVIFSARSKFLISSFLPLWGEYRSSFLLVCSAPSVSGDTASSSLLLFWFSARDHSSLHVLLSALFHLPARVSGRVLSTLAGCCCALSLLQLSLKCWCHLQKTCDTRLHHPLINCCRKYADFTISVVNLCKLI